MAKLFLQLIIGFLYLFFFMAPKNYAVVGLYNSIKNLNGHNQTAKFVFALFKFQNTLTKLKEMGRVDKTT